MTVRRTTLGGHTYEFRTLADLLARATPHRSGDVLAGCAAQSAAERVAAQTLLADLPLTTFLEEQVVGCLSGCARSRPAGGPHQPFTAPAVIPPTMNFWRYWNSRITGIAVSTAAAAKTPRLFVRSESRSP